MKPDQTALLLIGFQNDFFSPDGILHGFFEEPNRLVSALRNTMNLIDRLSSTSVMIISTPIIFTPDYSELVEPTGILKAIKDAGALKAGNKGSETVRELLGYGEKILEVPGKRGLNAFSNTDLDNILKNRDVKDVVMAGAVSSVCIDSTGRSAYDLGYNVAILSDCTVGRTSFEQDFYCEKIFPLYGEVIDHVELLRRLK